MHVRRSHAGLALIAVSGGFLGCAEDPAAPDDVSASLGNSPNVVQAGADIFPISGLTDADADGTATLTREVDGIELDLWASGDAIAPGDAFTVWAVIFNSAQGCDGPCGATSLGLPQAGALVMNFGGGVADQNGDLHIMGMRIDRHDTGMKQVLTPGRPGFGSGATNTYQLELHVIVRNHGPAEADPADLADQTSMVGAFCNLPPAANHTPPFSGCLDAGVAIFLPPGPPGQG